MGHTGHGQIHTHLGALALEVGAQAVDDLLADLLGNILAKDLTDAHNVLGGPGLLLGLQGELVTADVTDRALGGGNITFVNVTANRTYPLFHDRILHNLYSILICEGITLSLTDVSIPQDAVLDVLHPQHIQNFF